jgi:hypothetical protein
MTKKHEEQMKSLAVIAIIVALIGIIVAILIANGFFNKPNLSVSGYLIGSGLITQSQPEFGLAFRNDGSERGQITMEVSSDNENVSFIKKTITNSIPVTKDIHDIREMEFSLNKSSFENKIGNFTIIMNIINKNNKNTIEWDYIENCKYGFSKYHSCIYEWKK